MIYRRIDDDFLDPEVFRADSTLGVRGLMRAWSKGNVALVNAPGAGVADDKLIYTYVPDMIRYYLAEDAILPNVPSWRCFEPEQLDYVLAHLDSLVVKTIDGSGGYGILMGPTASAAERAAFAAALRQSPRSYIAQPVVTLRPFPPSPASAWSRVTWICVRSSSVGRDLRDDGRTDPRGAAQGHAHRQLEPGRRQQGHLDRRYRSLRGDKRRRGARAHG